jgi:hypothetical protein
VNNVRLTLPAAKAMAEDIARKDAERDSLPILKASDLLPEAVLLTPEQLADLPY